jgi:hypothetical protein
VTPLIWKRPGSIGDLEAIRGMGGVVAPLLAGFALATIALLVTSAHPAQTPQAPWAVACLAVSAVLFLNSIQYSYLAVRSGTTPTAYLEWDPAAKLDPKRLNDVRLEQAADRKLFDRFNGIAGLLYDGALLLFLAGLALVIVPQEWQPANGVALGAVSLAGAFEVTWILARWSGPLQSIVAVLVPLKSEVSKQVASTVDPIPSQVLAELGLLHTSAPLEAPRPEAEPPTSD